MRPLKLAIFVLAGTSSGPLFSSAAGRHEGGRITIVKSDDVVEQNPYFIDASSTIEEKKKSRERVDAALSKARRKPARSVVRKQLRRLSKTVKRHQRMIMLTAGIYAFRKELRLLARKILSISMKGAASDQEMGRLSLNINPTAILKILLFIAVMRQWQSSKGEGPSPAALMLLASGRAGNPLWSLLFSSLFTPQQSAYLPPVQQHYTFERFNNRYEKDGLALQKAMGLPHTTISRPSSTSASTALASLLSRNVVKSYNGTVIVLDLSGLDSSLSQLESLRDSVSFLLSESGIAAATERSLLLGNSTALSSANGEEPAALDCEVIVLLESPGGSPSEYALASQQIIRMRNKGLKVTVCVDKVAASGGYMIACTASPGQLFAAPFSILGSIGVVGQVVNVHKTLKNWGVDPLVFRAGKDKAPISAIGEVTTEGVLAVQNIVDNTHRAFKRHVVESRPVLEDSIESVATGDIWLGYDAYHRKLIDRIVTSDEYICERVSDGALVLKLVKMMPARYPFFRPTIARGGVGARWLMKPWLRVLNHIQEVVTGLSEAVGSLSLADDEMRLAMGNVCRPSSPVTASTADAIVTS